MKTYDYKKQDPVFSEEPTLTVFDDGEKAIVLIADRESILDYEVSINILKEGANPDGSYSMKEYQVQIELLNVEMKKLGHPLNIDDENFIKFLDENYS